MKHKDRKFWMVWGLCLLLLLSGCSRSSSEYTDGSVNVPDTYAAYQAGNFSFRFEAGWVSSNFDTQQSSMDTQAQLLGLGNNLCLTCRLSSPTRAIGTTDYLDFGYFETSGTVTMQDLESLMSSIDGLSASLKKTGVSCEELQKARIRSYNKGTIEALTFCYQVVNENVTAVVQTALIPGTGKVYVICLSDFTTQADSILLEQLLSTLTISGETDQ